MKVANNDLQILAHHEYAALDRIREDRHLCAHPAFIVEDQLYQPSPELVRAHIIHALQNLLIHAPLQGKSAIARFDKDLMSPSFPTTAEEIGIFIRTRYLDRAKEVLVVNLIKAIMSAPFGSESESYASKTRTLALTLSEIAKAKTAIYDALMPTYVAGKFELVSSEELLNICPFLEIDPRIWGWLKAPDRMRLKRLLETIEFESLTTRGAFDAFAIDELSETLLNRFNELDRSTKISILSDHPRLELVSSAIEVYADAGSFRGAERLGQSVILPIVSLVTADDVAALLKAAGENDQIWYAGGTSDILEKVFDETKPLLSKTRKHWQGFIDKQIERSDDDATKHFAYPGLQQRLSDNS